MIKLLNLKDVQIGEIYGFDIDGIIPRSHIGTYTVEVLNINPITNGNKGLVSCKSIQTGEEFYCSHIYLVDMDTCRQTYSVIKRMNLSGFLEEERIKKMKKLEMILCDSLENDNYSPNVCKDDIDVLRQALDICLGKNNEVVKGLANLIKKLDNFLAEQ